MRAPDTNLSRQDLANLLIEAPDTPMQMGVLMTFGGERLLAADGSFDLAAFRTRIGERVLALPELRQVLRAAGPLGSRATWVDRPPVLAEHVKAAAVPPPGGEPELLITVESLVAGPLSRARPLWELWVLTGLEGRRLALLLSVHHAVTDGLGMLRIATSLLDPAPQSLGFARRAAGTAAGGGGGWPAAAASVLAAAAATAGAARRAPAVALNRPIGVGRRMGVFRLRLSDVKAVARRRSAKVGELVLHLAAAALTAALLERGVEVEGRVANALLAVDPPHPQNPLLRRNQAGSVIVSLPLGGGDPAERLAAIAFESRRARAQQHFSTMEHLMVLTVLSGLGRPLSRRQRLVQLSVSNLVGPPRRLSLFGAPMLEALPITPISGSVTVDFCALSYAGAFEIAVLADAAAWPDLGPLLRGMTRAWRELEALVPEGARRPALPAAARAVTMTSCAAADPEASPRPPASSGSPSPPRRSAGRPETSGRAGTRA